MFMSCSDRSRRPLGALMTFAAILGLAPASAGRAQSAPDGPAVYLKWCAGCHGDSGLGDGDAATHLLPRPRDFTLGVYKFRSTPSGEVPTDADLLRIVNEGVAGTPMVGWEAKLSASEREAVVTYVKSLSPFFNGATPTPVGLGTPPAVTAEGLAEGQRVYQTLRCFECHGQAGRGDGTSVPTFADDAGFPLPASDLTEGWHFKGGGSVEQIYLRLYTGLDGTPMPSFGGQIESKVISDEQLWRLAQYVRSLSPEREPEVSQMIHVPAVTGPLPTTPDDAAWNAVDAHYVPLAGQIIVKPRWFVPSVDGLWLRAVHDGTRLALRLTWHDPSRSPDPAFEPWVARLVKTVAAVDGSIPSTQGPDRVAVTFPTQLEPDTLRGYFLSGDTRAPAYSWRWTSAPDSVEEGTGRGLTRFARRAGPTTVTHVARYDRGEWQLQLTRSLTASDGTAPTFVAGRPLPISFFVADGSNGEIGTRGAVASWYLLHLEAGSSQPTVR